MRALSWLWDYIKEMKYKYFFGLFLVLVFSSSMLFIPGIGGYIVDDIIIGGGDNLLQVLLILVSITLFRTFISYYFKLIMEDVSQRAIFKIRSDLFKKVQSMDFEFFDKTKSGDIMSRMTGDIEAIRHFIAHVIYTLFQNTLFFICAVIYMFTINTALTLLLLTIAPPLGIIAYLLKSKIKIVFTEIRKQYSVLNSTVQENINANRIVKAFAKELYESEKFEKENKKFSDIHIKGSQVWLKYFPLIEICAGTLSVILIYFGGRMVISNAMTLGELVIFSSLIWAIAMPMRMLGELLTETQNFVSCYIKTKELLDKEEAIKNPEFKLGKTHFTGSVKFRDVTFAYKKNPVLKNINFEVNPGETVAFIGATGSGKSSIINLLCRFYEINDGQILLDGINIKNINKKALRNNVALAMQDVFLFSDTIEGNIAFGVKNVKKEDLKRIANATNVADFAEKMPDGYNTVIGEMGAGLSGGQRQRISLARALIKDSPLLVLDDTTSSLDMETENCIRNNIMKCKKQATKFIIAHRISSVKNADMIYVMDNGKIIEYGRHKELIGKKGYYYNVFKTQLGDFNKKEAHAI
jgi:ATP-binding cassette subfamily B multidrug efflux pump